jgi:hypothetical protein
VASVRRRCRGFGRGKRFSTLPNAPTATAGAAAVAAATAFSADAAASATANAIEIRLQPGRWKVCAVPWWRDTWGLPGQLQITDTSTDATHVVQLQRNDWALSSGRIGRAVEHVHCALQVYCAT